MPLYGDEFFEDEHVATMEPAAEALYMRLLWRQWKHGPLPADLSKLRLLFPKFSAQWDGLWPQIELRFLHTDDGRLSNPRCASETRLANSKIRSAKKNGSKGGIAKALRSKRKSSDPRIPLEQRPSDPLPLTGPDLTRPDCVPTEQRAGARPSPTRKRSAVTWREVLARPDYDQIRDDPAFGAAWGRWIAWTETAGSKASTPKDQQAATILNRALEWGPHRFALAVDHSIAGNYQGLFEPKATTNGVNTKTGLAPNPFLRQLFERQT